MCERIKVAPLLAVLVLPLSGKFARVSANAVELLMQVVVIPPTGARRRDAQATGKSVQSESFMISSAGVHAAGTDAPFLPWLQAAAFLS